MTCLCALRAVRGLWSRATLLACAVAISSPALAGGVQLTWTANSETNLAGYIVLYGTASRVYTHSVEIGPATAAAHIGNLADGVTYYFAVRAFNTAGQQSALSNEFSIHLPSVAPPPAPAITSTSPTSGPTAGGTLVTLVGSHFVTGATVRFGTTPATLQSLTATSITVLAPARPAGVVSISVTNPDGQVATRTAAFTYVAPAPAITAFAPATGPTTGGTSVTIAGANFVAGAVVRFGTTLGTVQSVSATSIVALTPPLAAGAVPVSVTLPDGQSVVAGSSFTFTAPPPVVSAVGPAWGPTVGGTPVTITGNQFQGGATVLFGSTPATVTSVSATAITVLAPAHVAGSVGVTVINPGGAQATMPSAFLYQALAPAPSALTPSRGSVTGGNVVVVTGQYFAAGATVTFDGVAGTVQSVTSSAIEVRAPARPAGTVAVTVRNPDGQSKVLAAAYTYDPLAPSIESVTPSAGPVAGGTVVTITGMHFGLGSAVRIGGSAATVTAASDGALQVLTPAGVAGAADVLVRTAAGLEVTRVGAFTYESPAPPAPEPFVRYFAEGVQGSFFDTRFALANPHDRSADVRMVFTDPFGQETTMAVIVPAGGHTTIDRTNMPALANEAFATRVESDHEIGVDRTVQWQGAWGYGAHSETGIVSPRTTWYFAEGATHSGFEVFYLLQNPSATGADVLVRYMLGTGTVIEKVHYVAPFARTNIWVNFDDPRLRGAEVSAQLVSLNDVPFVAERSMYQSRAGQLFTAGHNSAGIAAPATRWFLAEGATGDFFDMFVLIANPQDTAAELEVAYLLPDGAPLTRRYTVGPNSRFTVWVDHEDPRLRQTDVSVIVTSTNAVPVIVERTMWWPGTRGGPWTEAHNSAGATTTAARWVLSDGVSSVLHGASTYALVANTAAQPTTVRFTLLTPDGSGRSEQTVVAANSRFSIDVATTFPEALDRRFGLLVESLDEAPLVVERASYWNADGVAWAAGTNSLAMPLTASPR